MVSLSVSTLQEIALRKKALRSFILEERAANVRVRHKNNPLCSIGEVEGEQDRGSALIRAPKSTPPIISYRAMCDSLENCKRQFLASHWIWSVPRAERESAPHSGSVQPFLPSVVIPSCTDWEATINKKNKTALIAIEAIASRIVVLRGQRVMLDVDLAALYSVTTKRLNEQVKRNQQRFPKDFMFRLTSTEVETLNRSQIATGSQKHRDPRFAPYAFTEHGALMAAMVLNSPRATEVSVYVVRAFVGLRDTLIAHKELAERLGELESRLERKLATHDQAIAGILGAIRQLMSPPEPTKKRRIGFVQND